MLSRTKRTAHGELVIAEHPRKKLPFTACSPLVPFHGRGLTELAALHVFAGQLSRHLERTAQG